MEGKSEVFVVRATNEEYDIIRSSFTPRARAIILTKYADPTIIPASTVASRRHFYLRFTIINEDERQRIARLTPWQRTAYLLDIANRLDELVAFAKTGGNGTDN